MRVVREEITSVQYNTVVSSLKSIWMVTIAYQCNRKYLTSEKTLEITKGIGSRQAFSPDFTLITIA